MTAGAGRAVKRWLRPVVERVLRRFPVSRVAFAQQGILQSRVAALETALGMQRQHAASLSAAAQVAPYDAHRLETQVPVSRTMEERTVITTLCRDAGGMPKVPNAGRVLCEPDGTLVQIMHNGIKVLAGGYYGPWMQDLIERCNGHHEPQEEVVFAEILRHIGASATMF